MQSYADNGQYVQGLTAQRLCIIFAHRWRPTNTQLRGYEIQREWGLRFTAESGRWRINDGLPLCALTGPL